MDKNDFPATLDFTYWEKSVKGSPLEKGKIGELLKSLDAEFTQTAKVAPKLLDVSDLDAKAMPGRRGEIKDQVFKPLDNLTACLKKIEQEANKAMADAKKAGKESAVKVLLSSVKEFNGDLAAFAKEVDKIDEELAKGVVSAKAAAKPADPKVAALKKKQVERLGGLSRKAIRELQSGKANMIPFVFGASKVKVPWKAGKDWTEPCVIYMHPKANKSSRSILSKLLNQGPVWAIGEARCEDKKKIIFNCTETPPANIKQLKDALKYQMKGYAPALRVMKGGKVEGEEASEGKDDEALPADAGELEDVDLPDTGSVADDAAVAVAAKNDNKAADAKRGAKEEAEQDEASDEESDKKADELKKRFANRSSEIQKAIVKGDNAAKDLKEWTVRLSEALKNNSDLKQAETLLKRIETRLAGGATDEEISKELDTAINSLATARKGAEDGAKKVANLIRQSYKGDAQEKKATEGAVRIEAAAQKLLATAVDKTIRAQLAGADTRKRAQVADVVKAIADAIEKNDLLPDVDKSPFDPALNVVAPYVTSLKNVESMLRSGR